MDQLLLEGRVNLPFSSEDIAQVIAQESDILKILDIYHIAFATSLLL